MMRLWLDRPNLTSTSAAIGKLIAKQFTDEELSVQKQIHLGNVFIGAFHMDGNGYINIYRDEMYSEYDKNAPYIIIPNEKFSDLS